MINKKIISKRIHLKMDIGTIRIEVAIVTVVRDQ